MKRKSEIDLAALAMLGGTGSALVIALGVTLVVNGLSRTPDLARATAATVYISFFVGTFAWVGWVLFVLPLARSRRGSRWLHHDVCGELVWALLAVGAFTVLVASWAGLQVLAAAWIPAAIGLLAGLWHRRLWASERRNRR